jgi:signal peptidase I
MTKQRFQVAAPPSPSQGKGGRSEQRPTEQAPPDLISRHMPSAAAIRETIESVVVAFVLAFLFRTFEAEAFVIPTGSMAPTLMGRHKDLVCPKCGCPYQVSASEEVDADGRSKGPQFEIRSGTCPMCRYTDSQLRGDRSYNGDRILVSKLAYELADPDRFDVIVFKFPGDAQTDSRTNFIKRLVGLPGETVRIEHGDLWIRRQGEEEFRIARKAPEKLLAMLQPVFDNNYMPKIAEFGWPARWQPEPSGDGSTAGAWTSDDYTTFRTDGAAKGQRWLRYHHLVPSYEQWATVEQGGAQRTLKPQLIADCNAYNTGRYAGSDGLFNPAPDLDSLGRFWAGDLALRCAAEIESDQGELAFELRKGGRQFQCRFDMATGLATLSISGQDMERYRPTARTNVRGLGQHEIIFSNCDNELRLWIDGRVVQFDSPTTYDKLGNTMPDQSDLSPVGVASNGAAVRLSRLALVRDIYYISDMSMSHHQHLAAGNFSVFSSALGEEARLRNRTEEPTEFVLAADQFFVLGDNSARSKDGRLWGPNNYWVPRELLIGKALFIYWPHSWNKVPYLNLPFPYFPNFARMGLVR